MKMEDIILNEIISQLDNIKILLWFILCTLFGIWGSIMSFKR